jgi:phosphotransferase system HPr-like phosphotransfer protein
MTLGAGPGDEVVLSAEGDGADAALDALEQYLTTPEH